MHIVKLSLIVFVLFFVLFTAISLLIPSHIRISRAINLKADRDSLFRLIKNTNHWRYWHPGFLQKDVKTELAANDLVVKPVTITDTLVAVQLIKKDKRPVVNGWRLYSFPSTDSLTLQWYMDFRLPWYPWHKFSSLFYEKTYGTMMEQGLTNLKQRVEQ